MSLIKGCQEGRGTPKLVEVRCPRYGAWVDVFVKLGGAIGQTGTLAADETCACGYELPAGSYEAEIRKQYDRRDTPCKLVPISLR